MVGENKVAATRYHKLSLLLGLPLPVHAHAKHGNHRNNLGKFFGPFLWFDCMRSVACLAASRFPRNMTKPIKISSC